MLARGLRASRFAGTSTEFAKESGHAQLLANVCNGLVGSCIHAPSQAWGEVPMLQPRMTKPTLSSSVHQNPACLLRFTSSVAFCSGQAGRVNAVGTCRNQFIETCPVMVVVVPASSSVVTVVVAYLMVSVAVTSGPIGKKSWL